MWTLVLGATFSLLPFCGSDSYLVFSRSCSYAGVFHVEGGARYSLTFDQAKEMCQKLGTSLATLKQVTEAYDKGLQTCRYGWIIDGTPTILRHTSHMNCASNQTGVKFGPGPLNMSYDAYCFNVSDQSGINCASVVNPVRPKDNSTASENVSTTALPDIYGTNMPGFDTEATSGGPITDDTLATPDPDDATGYSGGTRDPGIPGSETAVTKDFAKTVAGTKESAEEPSSSEAPDVNRKSNSHIKDWVIILIVLLVVAFILLVCAAVYARLSLCGKQAVLMITTEPTVAAENKAGPAEAQEMVMLMDEEAVQKNNGRDECKVTNLENSK